MHEAKTSLPFSKQIKECKVLLWIFPFHLCARGGPEAEGQREQREQRTKKVNTPLCGSFQQERRHENCIVDQRISRSNMFRYWMRAAFALEIGAATSWNYKKAISRRSQRFTLRSQRNPSPSLAVLVPCSDRFASVFELAMHPYRLELP